MYTQLVKIFEYGLKGETEKVRQYGEQFIGMYGTKNLSIKKEISNELASKFRDIIEGEKGNEGCLDKQNNSPN